MSLFEGRFSGRAAVITGGASGLGRSVATRIIAEGGRVSLWDIYDESLTLAAREIGAAHSVAVDVSDQGAVAPVMPAEVINMSIPPSAFRLSAIACATAP